MKERTKFNNGKPIDSTTLEQSEMSLAVTEWSEGDEALSNAIISCTQNEIPTLASCAGHKITDSPYLTMIITPQNAGRILNIMNELSVRKCVDISIDLQQVFGDAEQECRSILTIHGNMFNKKECFQSIANAAEKSIKPEQANPLVQAMWKAHKATRIHGDNGERLYNGINFFNEIIGKKLIISVNRAPRLFANIVGSIKFQKEEFDHGYSYYTQKSLTTEKIIKKLNDITEVVQHNIIVNVNDEFYDITPRGEFCEKIKVNETVVEDSLNGSKNVVVEKVETVEK